MKCPVCEAWAYVKETRKSENDSVRRRYECGNLHRFTTKEYVVTAVEDMVSRQPEEVSTHKDDES